MPLPACERKRIVSNEELVQAIQAGERTLMPVLWQQMEQFVKQQASRCINQLDHQYGVEFDDLYQSGYLALVQAVDSYKPNNGAPFIAWMALHLKTEFAKTAGYYTKKKNVLNLSVSLHTPIGEEENFTLLHTIADPVDRIEKVEELIYQTQLRETLNAVLDTLPIQQSKIIREYDLEGLSFQKLSQSYGLSHQILRQRRKKGLQKLRKIKKNSLLGKRLYSFIEIRTPYFMHVGINRFNTTNTSAVEEAVLRRERLSEIGVHSMSEKNFR